MTAENAPRPLSSWRPDMGWRWWQWLVRWTALLGVIAVEVLVLRAVWR